MPLSATELIIVAVVLLLLFGSTQLPKLARGLGEAKRELETAAKDDAASTD
ncbi:MAG: twin-arginine translocase TatA/TatE family subunit [Actinomycetota bacterium]|nr:twin-arginine translocase TatA/TatE family subunit [Actinomycetota bacterium]